MAVTAPNSGFIGYTGFIVPASQLAAKGRVDCHRKAPLFGTADGGHTWSQVDIGSACPAGSALTPVFFGSGRLVGVEITGVFGKKAHLEVFTTKDGDVTWSLRAKPTLPMPGLDENEGVSPQIAPPVVALGSADMWLLPPARESSTGAPMAVGRGRRSRHRASRSLTRPLHFASALDGWISSGSAIYATHNGGRSWERVYP